MSDVLPPPPPPRSSDSCWKWGAITCGIGCSLAVIAVVVGGFLFMKSPIMKSIVDVAQNADIAKKELQRVWTKVDQYHKDKGKYPDKLDALVPNYLTKDDLHFSKEPNGPEWTYHKPPADSDDSFPMLEYKLTFNFPTAQGQPTPTINILITKGGEATSQSNSSYSTRGPRVRFDSDEKTGR